MNVYGVPFVNPLTVIGEDVPVTVSPVSITVTMYEEIGAPFPVAPLNSTIALLFAGSPPTTVGGLGVPAGRTVIAFDADPVPTPFTAATVNV